MLETSKKAGGFKDRIYAEYVSNLWTLLAMSVINYIHWNALVVGKL
ncbi:MAG TPA: hypothetical protein VKM55_05805 [Candidatus Lokiarchaeia archaeon]|nr:hypothetical protein [Candidatus Lokiarchaeia archaeon]